MEVYQEYAHVSTYVLHSSILTSKLNEVIVVNRELQQVDVRYTPSNAHASQV